LTTYHLPYGKAHLTFTLLDDLNVQLLAPHDAAGAADPLAAVTQALESPLGGRLLTGLWDDLGRPSSVVRRPSSVAIAINDKTRPVPHKELLPPLLARLEGLGFAPADITLLIATGTHAPMRPDEFPQVIPPDVLARYPVISHDCDDAANLI